MDPTRKQWNSNQKALRKLLSDPARFREAIDLFMQQHAEVHSAAMSSSGNVSFEDEAIHELNDLQMREIPEEHSIVWILWHLARIEDVTMNILVAGDDQVFSQGDWQRKINLSVPHTGNAMTTEEVKELTREIDIGAIKEYRLAVGRQTEQVVRNLEPKDLRQKPAASRLEFLLQEGAVVEKAKGLIDYWSQRDIAGLLLMPATRHPFVHLNEAVKIKNLILS
jgi:hypothetical protein